MKKLTTLILSVLAILCLSLGLAACAHTHTFSSEWTTDETHHWHAATCEHKTEADGKAEHAYEWKIDVEATEQAAGKKHQECTVCGYKTALDTEIPPTPHEHTFSSEWTKDVTAHWHVATCEHKTEVKDKTAHSYNDKFVCTACGYAKYVVNEEETFAAAVLLENVNNFSYVRTVNGDFTVKTEENQSIPTVIDSQTEEFVTTATQGYKKDYDLSGTEDNNIHLASFVNSTPPQTEQFPLDSTTEYYFSVENGRDYVFYKSLVSFPDEYGWKKTDFNDIFVGAGTYGAYIYSELSFFKEVSRNFNLFTYDENTKTYKNSTPLTFSETDDSSAEIGTYSLNYTNMYYEFKIGNGIIEWMQLTLDYTITSSHDWVTYPDEPIYVYYNGALQGKISESTQTGTMTVKYYDINESQVSNFPTEYTLGEQLDDYWCSHSNLGAIEASASTHRQKCNDCNAIILWETHHFENGVCNVCQKQCAHQNLMDSYFTVVDNDNHAAYCMDCGSSVNVAHNYDENDYCAACEHTYCEHTGYDTFTRYDNDTHGYHCPTCRITTTEEHDYVEGHCATCNADFCEHEGLSAISYQTNTSEHYKYCSDCGDRISAPHTFDGDICTVCEYEICHHENLSSYDKYEYYHSTTCPDCYEYVYDMHEITDGVCTVCGYDESCAHDNTSTLPDGNHLHKTACTDCGCIFSSNPHDFNNGDGHCPDCGYDCEHLHQEPGYPCSYCGVTVPTPQE